MGGGFEKASIEKVKTIAKMKGLKPGRVLGTTAVQLTKGDNSHIGIISWEEFQKLLRDRKLAVYEYGGFMKIMKENRK